MNLIDKDIIRKILVAMFEEMELSKKKQEEFPDKIPGKFAGRFSRAVLQEFSKEFPDDLARKFPQEFLK